MRSHDVKRGFTLIELLVVIAIIAILASLLFPVFARAREKARQTTCLSQQRQIATAALMYVQDNNGKFPGTSWSTAIQQYLSSGKMYLCPSSNHVDGQVSYGYNGALVAYSGDGVSEAMISVPTEVGLTADSTPEKPADMGGLIVGGGGMPISGNGTPGTAVNPDPRHSKGLIMSFTDGHAKYLPDGFNEKNISNTITRAFFLAPTYGMLENPSGGVADATNITWTTPLDIMVGGDSAVAPLLTAAADVYKKEAGKSWFSRGFFGVNYTRGRPADTDATTRWIWGDASQQTPSAALINIVNAGATYQGIQIATDAMVFIVSKNSKLTTNNAASGANLGFDFQGQYSTRWGTFVTNTAQMGLMFGVNSGVTANTFTGYTLRRDKVANNSNTLRQGGLIYFLRTVLGTTGDYPGALAAIGPQAIDVENELDMVDKVANDPYGIGYCSSAVADPDRVTILAIDSSTTTTTLPAATLDNPTYVYPRKNLKYRWYAANLTTDTENAWPYYRPLYVFGNPATTVPAFFGQIFGTPTVQSEVMKVIYDGPMFKGAYFLP